MIDQRHGTPRGGKWLISFVLAGALGTTGCGEADRASADAARIDSASDPIVGGQLNNGDPAVVALIAAGNMICTGTLIRPTVVLTAAHCVPPHIGEFGVNQYTQMQVFFGSDVFAGGQVRNVVEGWTHPGWHSEKIEDDIALLRIDQAGPATPIPFNTDAMGTIDIGNPVRLIGFGMTGTNQFNSIGKKRQATSAVSEVFQFVFTMNINPSGTCNGDSGGTALMDRGAGEVVVGVHSRSDCETTSIDTRTDDYQDDIYAFIGETPGTPQCTQDGMCATGCGMPDPDCPCAGDGFCTDACSDVTLDPDCDPACGADGFCAPSCPMPDPDCGGEENCGGDGVCNESCASDPDCGGGTSEGSGWTAGDLEPSDYDGVLLETGGCTTANPAQGDGEAPWTLVALTLGLGLARRRRH